MLSQLESPVQPGQGLAQLGGGGRGGCGPSGQRQEALLEPSLSNKIKPLPKKAAAELATEEALQAENSGANTLWGALRTERQACFTPRHWLPVLRVTLE